MEKVLPAMALALAALSGCASGGGLPGVMGLAPTARPQSGAGDHGDLDILIRRYAAYYGVPERLVHRVVRRESNYNPSAVHRGNYGLMQIKPATARGMGYGGSARGLLDAETNLKYAVKYLKGAWLVAGRDENRAVRYYAAGYYYAAKRKGMLEEVGLRS